MTAQAIPSRSGHPTMLGVILLFALVVRLGWALTRPTTDAALNQLPDQHDYLSLARSVLHGNGFVFRDPRFPDELKAFRTPGYPIFLAMCGASARIARAVQALVDTSTILAIYTLAKKLVRSRDAEKVGLAAAALVAFNPFLIYFSGLLLTETLFTGMLAWATLLLVQANQSSGKTRYLQWLAAGLLLTTSILVRPSGIALPTALGITAVLLSRRASQRRSRDMGFQPMRSDVQAEDDVTHKTNREKVVGSPSPGHLLSKTSEHGLEAHVTGTSLATSSTQNLSNSKSYERSRVVQRAFAGASAMLLLTLLTLLPWATRNHRVLGRWIPLDTNSGFTLYDGFNPSATGASDQTFVKRMPQLQTMGEVQRSEYLSRLALEYISQHPGRAVSLAFRKLARTGSPITLSSEFGQLRYQIVAAMYAVPFDLLMIAGLLMCGLSRGAKAFLLTPAVYFSIVHALTVGSLRYRIPVEPPLAILAALALVRAAEKMRSQIAITTRTPEASR